jgi:hypothetical protein
MNIFLRVFALRFIITAVHEIAVMYEIAELPKNLTLEKPCLELKTGASIEYQPKRNSF